MHIYEYLYRVSFLTTLNIYKNYFKDCHVWCKVMKKVIAIVDTRMLWLETFLPSFIIFFIEAIASLHQGFCNQGASWSSVLDELKNFAANIFLKLVC